MSNLLVVEVKPRNAVVTRMADDLKKLTRFRRDLSPQNGLTGNYYAAYFWLYGLEAREWKVLRGQVLLGLARSEFDPSLVSCFLHERAGGRAIQAAWEWGCGLSCGSLKHIITGLKSEPPPGFIPESYPGSSRNAARDYFEIVPTLPRNPEELLNAGSSS
jgi:hypothetical protein